MKIAIDAALCLKTKFTKATCTKCLEACPTKSINESLEVDNSCTNCGLCLASCPVEATAGSSYGIEPIRQLISKEAPIRLGCQKCQPDSPWPCLGFLEPILLLTFVYSGKDTNREVTIYQKECEACNPAVFRHITWAVEETNRLLGPNKKSILASKERGSIAAPEAISRRQFFAELWGASVSTVREVAFPISDRLDPIPRQEMFLANGAQLLPRYIDNQTLFKSVEINNSCNACGLCEKMCRQDALTNVQSDGTLEIAHNPVQCNNCGICADQCPKGALTIIPATSLEKRLIKQASLPLCTNCGDPYQPIGHASVCLDCMQKAKTLSL